MTSLRSPSLHFLICELGTGIPALWDFCGGELGLQVCGPGPWQTHRWEVPLGCPPWHTPPLLEQGGAQGTVVRNEEIPPSDQMTVTSSPTPSCFYCTNNIGATRTTKRGKGQAVSHTLNRARSFNSSLSPSPPRTHTCMHIVLCPYSQAEA